MLNEVEIEIFARIARALERQVEQNDAQMARNDRWRDENMKMREADLQRQLSQRYEELAEARQTIEAFTERIDVLLVAREKALADDAVGQRTDQPHLSTRA